VHGSLFSGGISSQAFIFAATGTEDFASSRFTNQIEGMLGQESGNFREADNETEGNLAFRIKEGDFHDGRASAEYAYNGMLWFWNHGEKVSSVKRVTENTLVKGVINNPVFGSYGDYFFRSIRISVIHLLWAMSVMSLHGITT